MQATDRSLLTDLKWIVRDPASGRIEVSDGNGSPLPGTLEAAELFSTSSAGTDEQEVRFVAANGATTQLVARRVPGTAALAVALDRAILERAVGPVVESLVNQIAHDIRNFAFTIALQAELGERRAGAGPEVKDHLAAVLRQVDALKGFLEKLLMFGRPVTLRPTTVNAGDLVRQQAQAVRFSWRPDAPPLAISVDVEADASTVSWDPQAIGVALLALLDNAARSADPAPPIAVRVTRDGARVAIEICDRGKGIPADKLASVGIPMRVRRHGGAGLGLAVARKMVAAHGGTLAITTGPDGTTVRLVLPVEVRAG